MNNSGNPPVAIGQSTCLFFGVIGALFSDEEVTLERDL